MERCQTNKDKRLKLYMRAASKHNTLMVEATHLKGCDRHLMGLSCIATEEGLPVPALFEDPAYTKSGGGGNYVLSTSFIGYTPIYGAVAPMVEHGYGSFYKIENHQIVPLISEWKSSPHTDSAKFCDALFQSLDDMGDMLQRSKF